LSHAFPEELSKESLGREIFDWRPGSFKPAGGKPDQRIVMFDATRSTTWMQCNSITALLSYCMDEPYFCTEDIERVALTMRIAMAARVKKARAKQAIACAISYGAVMLNGDQDADVVLNVLNDRTLLIGLLDAKWVQVKERADSTLIRGDAMQGFEYGGCPYCLFRDEEKRCSVFRKRREDDSPVGVVCSDFYPVEEASKPVKLQYVSITGRDVALPPYTALMPDPILSTPEYKSLV